MQKINWKARIKDVYHYEDNPEKMSKKANDTVRQLVESIEEHIDLYSVDEIIELYENCLELDFLCYACEIDGITREFRLRESYFDDAEDAFSPFISSYGECKEIFEKYKEYFHNELFEKYNQDNADDEFDEDYFLDFVREEYEAYCNNVDFKEILRIIDAEKEYKMCMLGYINDFCFSPAERNF